jgi:hypothetical protein
MMTWKSNMSPKDEIQIKETLILTTILLLQKLKSIISKQKSNKDV